LGLQVPAGVPAVLWAVAHRTLLQAGEPSSLPERVGGALDHIDGAVVVEAAAAGDGLARRRPKAAGRSLGRGPAGVVALLNPDTIALGGRVGEAAAPCFEGPVARELRARALPVLAGAARILPGTLGDAAAPVGAAVLAPSDRATSS